MKTGLSKRRAVSLGQNEKETQYQYTLETFVRLLYVRLILFYYFFEVCEIEIKVPTDSFN